MRYVANLY